MTKNHFTKYYFIGDKHVTSKLGVGKFNNAYGISGNNITAGQKDYAARMMDIEKQREQSLRIMFCLPMLTLTISRIIIFCPTTKNNSLL